MSPQRTGRPTSTGACAECDGLRDVGPAADTTVDVHLGAVADGRDDARQDVGGRGDPVEDASAVVRHRDPRHPERGDAVGVVGPQQALHHDGETAPLAEEREVVEGDRRVEVADERHDVGGLGVVG